jgi:hypothetical protein
MLDYWRPATLRLARNVKGNACTAINQGFSKGWKSNGIPTMGGEDPNLSFFLGDVPRMARLLAVTCD